jgi:anti-sigma B factor antagonist
MVNLQPQIARVFDIIKALPAVSIFKDDAEPDDYLAAIQDRVQERLGIGTAVG